MPLRFIPFYLLKDDLFGFPISLVAPAKTHEVIKATAVKRIAQLPERLFKVLICRLVSAKEVLMVPKEEEHKDAEKGCQRHDHYREYLPKCKLIRIVSVHLRRNVDDSKNDSVADGQKH